MSVNNLFMLPMPLSFALVTGIRCLPKSTPMRSSAPQRANVPLRCMPRTTSHQAIAVTRIAILLNWRLLVCIKRSVLKYSCMPK